MLAYIPYMDPMGDDEYEYETSYLDLRVAIKDVWLLHMANKNWDSQQARKRKDLDAILTVSHGIRRAWGRGVRWIDGNWILSPYNCNRVCKSWITIHVLHVLSQTPFLPSGTVT